MHEGHSTCGVRGGADKKPEREASQMSLKRKSSALCGVLIFILSVTGAACAATQTWPLEGSHTLTEDLYIELETSAADSDKAAILVGSGESVTGEAGVKVSVDISDGAQYVRYYGIMADGGTISIDKYYFKGGDTGTTKKAPQTGIRAKAGGQVTIGDDAEIHANNSGSAIIVTGAGSTVTVGDNGTFYGTTSTNGGGTVAAGESNNPNTEVGAGKIVIGDNAYIINDGYASSSADNHIAVFASGYSEIGSVTIGEKAQIYAQGTGTGNHAIQAGDGDYGTRGTVDIGDGARIATFGDSSTAAYSSLTGSVITIGEGSNLKTSGKASYGTFARAGGEVSLGADTVVTTSGDNSVGLFARGSVVDEFKWPDADLIGTSVINTGENVHITTSGKEAFAVMAESKGDSGAEVTLGDGNTIATYGDYGFGLFAKGDKASIEALGGLTIETHSSEYAYGIRAYDGATVTAGSTTITTEGNGSLGLNVSLASDVTLGAKSSVTTKGESALGVYVATDAEVSVGAESVIQTTGNSSIGVYADGGTFSAENLAISTEGDNADGLYVAYVVNQTDPDITYNGHVTLTDSKITTTGENAYGAYITGSGTEFKMSEGTITTSGEYAVGVFATGSSLSLIHI